MKLDLSNAVDENPYSFGDPEVKKLPPIQKAGYRLAQIVLVIIGVYILFIIILFLFTDLEYVYSKELSENIDKLSGEKQSYRDFVFQMSQLILLNLLLPILTAILGYIFGSNESKDN